MTSLIGSHLCRPIEVHWDSRTACINRECISGKSVLPLRVWYYGLHLSLYTSVSISLDLRVALKLFVVFGQIPFSLIHFQVHDLKAELAMYILPESRLKYSKQDAHDNSKSRRYVWHHYHSYHSQLRCRSTTVLQAEDAAANLHG